MSLPTTDGTIEVRGLNVHYVRAGQGPVVIAAHCSSASHREWNQLMERLADQYTVIAPDLVGYGGSDSWPEDRPWEPSVDSEILVRLAEMHPGPVHLVGHSYGGAMAVEAAAALGDRVASLSVVEPVTFHLLRTHNRLSEWREISRVAAKVQKQVGRGMLRAAAATYMGFWLGSRLRWWLMPPSARRGIVATVEKVAKEFSSIEHLDAGRSNYAEIRAPSLLIYGERTRRPAIAVVDVLGDTLPNAHIVIIRGAGHMSPYTHRGAVFDSIELHVRDSGTSPLDD